MRMRTSINSLEQSGSRRAFLKSALLFAGSVPLLAADGTLPGPAMVKSASAITLKHTQEIAFGPYGGAELFFADIDGDGQTEILAYQGPAVFGSKLYRSWPHVAAAFPKSTCLSAFKKDGRRLWTFGEPNPTDRPYITHAHESCVATGDVNGDGVVEIALADGDRILLLDGPTGKLRAEVKMPEDNFYIVQILGEATKNTEAALVVKNGEGGYGQWKYGEPLVGINAAMQIVWGPKAIPGAGHHISALDLDEDGQKEYFIGYCMVKRSGEWKCLVDAIDPARVDASREHVDYVDILRRPLPEKCLFGFAGSNKAYLVRNDGRTLFVKPGKHVQSAALGRFRTDSEYQLAVYNDDGPMALYDTKGNELWSVPTQERWPLGMPKVCAGRVFHRNRPVLRLPLEKDYILYTDGGWPWAMDGDGRIGVEFAPPENSRQQEMVIPAKARADDMGYGFATKIVDWGGGVLTAVIYDRRFLWVFPLA